MQIFSSVGTWSSPVCKPPCISHKCLVFQNFPDPLSPEGRSVTPLCLGLAFLTIAPRTLMSTAVDILFCISTCITPDNQLLKVKYAFNLETLLFIATKSNLLNIDYCIMFASRLSELKQHEIKRVIFYVKKTMKTHQIAVVL